jgi:hypothetical protein
VDFLNRNAGAFQAIAAVLTVLLAVAALIGVKLQIDAADKLQRAQSARDIYREYLSLAINKPEFTNPNYCEIVNSPQQTGYEYFVEYIFYAAEQTIQTDVEWTDTFLHTLKDHGQYVCTLNDLTNYGGEVSALIKAFQTTQCKNLTPCGT